MRKFGLIGYPLSHSFSKKYFSQKFLLEKLDNCSYELYPLTSIEKLPELIRNEGVEGLNVTIPYKSAVIQYIDRISPEADEVGAVNVIKISRKRTGLILNGFNSDITGIMDTLLPVMSPEIRNALVLGTGGSSKAVCYVLNKINVHYTLISRTLKPGTITYADVNSDILRKTQLIINTTPLGMFPDTEGIPSLDYSSLGETHILFDLVYNPEITSFLRIGKERGCKILTGIKMLCSQAERSWEIWNDDSL